MPLQIFLDYSGDAEDGEDYSPAAGALIIPAGTTSLPITIQTVNDDRVEPDKTADGRSSTSGQRYRVGDPDGGDVVIKSEDLPEIIIVGGCERRAGAAARCSRSSPTSRRSWTRRSSTRPPAPRSRASTSSR